MVVVCTKQRRSKNQSKVCSNYSSPVIFATEYEKQSFWYCCAAVYMIKCLLIPCYHSTDFEVHRNWMAITHTLPLHSWYYATTSQWTLDYPPFFAYFEYLLSQILSKIIPSALVLQKDAYFSNELLYFQRFSVIVTDFFYVLSCYILLRWKDDAVVGKNFRAAQLLLTANVSLMMIDNMHFQYNGILSAFLILSLGFIMRKSYLPGALCYCILLNMKHIYLYYAPAYVLYYLVNYLPPLREAFVIRCAKLAVVLILPFILSFGPFIYTGGMSILQQIWRQLFPFERGLTHAYWAPNLWAIYNSVDWYFYQVLKLTRRLPSSVHPPLYTAGLVQKYSHSVLPTISPFGAFLITGLLLLPLFLLIHTKHSKNFSLLLTLSAFAFFLAGYHVHEKAIVLITIPYTILASLDHRFFPSFVVLSCTANVSLFPLFFTPFENALKVSMSLCYLFFSLTIMGSLCPKRALCILQKLYIFGLFILQIYCLIVHQVIFGNKLKFVPLMFTSLSTAFGICWIYIELLCIVFFEEPQTVCTCEMKQKTK